MRTNTLLLTIPLLVSGCWDGLVIKDQDAQPYVEMFIWEAKIRGVRLKIDFKLIIKEGDRIGNHYAVCRNKDRHRRYVIIDPSYEHSPMKLELIIFHELGHCILGRDHVEKQWVDHRPPSIMSDGIGENTYTEHREEYLNELFDAEVLEMYK